VTKTAVEPDWYSEDERIVGRKLESQASPVATEQSCMSLQRFGVTKVKPAEMFGGDARGTSKFAQSAPRFV
jgi:hypothetical protein